MTWLYKVPGEGKTCERCDKEGWHVSSNRWVSTHSETYVLIKEGEGERPVILCDEHRVELEHEVWYGYTPLPKSGRDHAVDRRLPSE